MIMVATGEKQDNSQLTFTPLTPRALYTFSGHQGTYGHAWSFEESELLLYKKQEG